MDRINISLENISVNEYLELLNLEKMPELGAEIELKEGLKVYNRTVNGIGIVDSVAFQLIYPIISGVACSLLASYLYDVIKSKPFVKIQVNGRSINNKSIEDIEKVIKGEKIEKEQNAK